MSTTTSQPDAGPAARPVTPMGILARALEGACENLASVAGVPAGVLDDLGRARALAGGLEPYLGRCTSPASPALQRLADRTRAHDWTQHDSPGGNLEQEMLSGHVEGQLLAFLVRLTRATDVLEVGMFTGYSALAMAEALPTDGRLVACEVDPDVAAFARECFDQSPAGDRIDVVVGPAAQTLARLADQGRAFDLVFVDADKGGYLDYVRTLVDTDLLAPAGLICVDNTLLQGETYAGGEPSSPGRAITDFNLAVAADPRVEQVMLPLRDGLTLIRRA